MEDIILQTELKMTASIENMEKRFNNVRVGRANPVILDGITVNYYNAETPLKQLATISIPEARQLWIKPFDRTSLGAIEKAIFEANIGLTPNNNGEVIILNIPALTEETRKECVKQVKAIAEDCKIALRNIRQDGNNEIKRTIVNEDEVKYATDEVQELINKHNKIIEQKLKDKESELMSI